MSATGKSDYLANALLDLTFGATTWSPPGTIYIALYTTSPSDGTNGSGTEVVGGGYARLSIVNDGTQFGAAVDRAKVNLIRLNFGTATADWGTIRAAAAYTASSAGNCLYWGPLVTTRVIRRGDRVRIPIGGIIFTD
jgi:hypothetical protein